VRVGETDRPKRRHRAPARPIHFNLRLEEGRLCCLVLVGVRADGTKELVAVADGQRESADAWAELLRDLRRRGMGAPVVMVGDGALVSDYGAKWPKAVAKVVDDAQALLCFFDYPAEHWGHLRTTNPIASTFSPVRARTRVTKGPGNKDAGLAMVSSCWRRPRAAGVRSTARTWSRWCVPGPGSRGAGWSSDPPSLPGRWRHDPGVGHRAAGQRQDTLAKPLARQLGLPLLGKDTIKEALFDTLGTGDRAWSRRLGAASYTVLLALAGELPAAVWTPTSTPTTARDCSRHARGPSRCSAAARPPRWSVASPRRGTRPAPRPRRPHLGCAAQGRARRRGGPAWPRRSGAGGQHQQPSRRHRRCRVGQTAA
jgi:Transposase, Mutator family